MSGGRFEILSRRAFAALSLQALGLWAARDAAAARDTSLDRGLGGTGAAPADPDDALGETLGQDRGIGGTGVIGTIRRFGSVVVNDLRVTFPPGVAVTIDGRPALARDLRLGHVVRVLARQRGGALVTRAIIAESEVVGRVDAVGPGLLVVLGQQVELPDGLAVPLHRPGDRLAVSGLRRLDGAVVASLVELRPPGPDRLRGPVAAGADGGLSVGGLAVVGLAPDLLGRRVSLAGTLVGARAGEGNGSAFHASSVRAEPRVPFAGADRVSLEAYVARAPDGLRLGSGLDVRAGSALTSSVPGLGAGEEGAVRAVVVARPDPAGQLDAQSLRVEARSRGHGGGPRGTGAPDPGRPGSPGRHGSPGGPADAGGGRRDGGPHGGPSGGAPGGGPGGGGPGGGGRGGPGR